jgi:hypothetical protein
LHLFLGSAELLDNGILGFSGVRNNFILHLRLLGDEIPVTDPPATEDASITVSRLDVHGHLRPAVLVRPAAKAEARKRLDCSQSWLRDCSRTRSEQLRFALVRELYLSYPGFVFERSL